MLVIDDNMFKLARMQEALLKVSDDNREENLENYKRTVAEIDSRAYEGILEEAKHIDEHNQSLEEELKFLEGIKNAYNQLLELQLSFKKICETYGNTDIELSDLSKLNIEYIENRINAINGYLLNLKNIEVNKQRLLELNEQLIDEEKKKTFLDKKLLELENTLRNNFSSAEGRRIVDGKLVYTSVVTEYEKIGLDFNRLLDDNDYLTNILSDADKEKKDTYEKVKAAEVCYNSIPTVESKQILNEINVEFLKIKYKVVMLRIAELLVQNNDSYDLFVKKRESILELIKYRLFYMEQLGMRTSIDPFSRTKVSEQLDTVLSLSDNSKTINVIRKEISQLNSLVEEMVSENNNYLITLSDTRDLIESSLGLGDIDISSVVSFEELLVKQEVADNQVVSVRNIPTKFNMNIVGQKTDSVIRRVYQMINKSTDYNKKTEEDVVPELVIVPSVLENIDLEEGNQEFVDEPIVLDFTLGDSLELEQELDEDLESDVPELLDKEETDSLDVQFSNIFETVTPFDEPSLFSDRTDSADEPKLTDIEQSLPLLEDDVLEQEENVEQDNLSEEVVIEDEMPEAFWVTQEDDEDEEEIISFDDQINALLSSEDNDTNKVRKRAA